MLSGFLARKYDIPKKLSTSAGSKAVEYTQLLVQESIGS